MVHGSLLTSTPSFCVQRTEQRSHCHWNLSLIADADTMQDHFSSTERCCPRCFSVIIIIAIVVVVVVVVVVVIIIIATAILNIALVVSVSGRLYTYHWREVPQVSFLSRQAYLLSPQK